MHTILGHCDLDIDFWFSCLEQYLLYITANFPQMCFMLDQFLLGHSSHYFDLSCFVFFLGKDINLCILKGFWPFKMHKKIFFSENLKKILGFTSKFRWGWVTLNTGIFFFFFLPNCSLE